MPMPMPMPTPEPFVRHDGAAARLGVSADLPHLGAMPPLRLTALGIARRPFRWLFKLVWSIEVSGEENVPTSGPVILAANHIAVVDGPLLVAMTRRRSLALAKVELFRSRGLAAFLSFVGQISVDRRAIDTTAIRRAVQVLRFGGILTVFPEGSRGSGDMERIRSGGIYLAMLTGATIVPVALFGTAGPRNAKSAIPRWQGRIAIMYGEPIVVPQRPWPRRHAEVVELTETIRRQLAAHVGESRRQVQARSTRVSS